MGKKGGKAKGGKAPATGGAGPPPEPEPDAARQLTEAVLDAAVHPSQGRDPRLRGLTAAATYRHAASLGGWSMFEMFAPPALVV